MVYLLSAYGHDVMEATAGPEGLAKAKTEHPELILLDIHMPQMDGYEVGRQLRADPECFQIPVVAVTAMAMVGDREKILAAGFSGYIAKPIEPEIFLSQVNVFLAGSGGCINLIAAPIQQEHEEAAKPAPLGKRPVVLFVDNVQTNIDLVRGILEPSGYEVATAMSARDGLDLAQRIRPDLIVSDIHMQPEDGYSFLRKVRDNPQLLCTPFVFLTASVWSIREKLHALEQGASKFLLRPIEPEAFLEEIEDSLRKAPGT